MGNRELFTERDVVYYWDWLEGLPGYEELNFLCANWNDFLKQCNPSAFARSWGADCDGWPKKGGFNSAGLFGQMCTKPKITVLEKIEILFEMSRVIENEWAREMIAGFLRNDRVVDPETGETLVLSFDTHDVITETKMKVIDHLLWEATE